jgi:hypothetical protein
MSGRWNKLQDFVLKDIFEGKNSVIQAREKYKETCKQGISIVVPTFKEKYISNIFLNYATSNYLAKELIIILNNNKLSLLQYQSWAYKFENIRLYQLDDSYSLGECLNFGINQAKYNYIARMDDDDYYGPNYLTDLMHVFNSTDAQITGKNPVFVYFEDIKSLYAFNHRNLIMGGTFLFKKEVFDKIRFRNISYREDYYFLLDCVNAGIKVYPSDIYNFIYMRHFNAKDHTFRISSEDFIHVYDTKKILNTDNPVPMVTV